MATSDPPQPSERASWTVSDLNAACCCLWYLTATDSSDGSMDKGTNPPLGAKAARIASPAPDAATETPACCGVGDGDQETRQGIELFPTVACRSQLDNAWHPSRRQPAPVVGCDMSRHFGLDEHDIAIHSRPTMPSAVPWRCRAGVVRDGMTCTPAGSSATSGLLSRINVDDSRTRPACFPRQPTFVTSDQSETGRRRIAGEGGKEA